MTDKKPLNIDIQSEIGQLDAVLLHTPGAEVENMTPKMAQRALYSDILNLSIAQEEYAQLSGVLEKLAKVYTVSDLLVKVLDNDAERQALIGKICVMEQVTDYFDMLMDMSSARLAKVLIEGLPAKINTLTSFLNEDYYALFPLCRHHRQQRPDMQDGQPRKDPRVPDHGSHLQGQRRVQLRHHQRLRLPARQPGHLYGGRRHPHRP